jgi:hypothetical protein
MQTQHAQRHTTNTDAAALQRFMKPPKVRPRVNKRTLIVWRTYYRPQGPSIHACAPCPSREFSCCISPLSFTQQRRKDERMHVAQVAHIPLCSLVDGSTDARQGGGSCATVVAKGGTARVSNGPSCPLSTNTAWACTSSSPRCAPVCLHASLIPKQRTQMFQSS